MNIKTFAVVKGWVMNKTSTPQASSMMPEPRWYAGCPRSVGSSARGGQHAMPQRWACHVTALGLAGGAPGRRCFGGKCTKPLSGVNLLVQEPGSPLASEAGICLEAALQSLINIHLSPRVCSDLPMFGKGRSSFLGQTNCSSVCWRKGFVLPMPFGSRDCKALVLLWLQMVTQDACAPWLKGGREEVRSEQSTLFLLFVLIRYQKGCASPIRR